MLIELALSAAIAISPAAAAGGSGECSIDLHLTGACGQVSNGGTQVDVGANLNRPGSGGGGGTDNVGWNPVGPGGGEPAPPVRLSPGERGSPDCAPDSTVCVPVYEDPAPLDEEAADEPADEIPAVTLADLASFAPARPGFAAEPEAAGVVGMPTNFVAEAQEQTLGGALFGRPVTVRFTPVAFVFDYGDGSIGRSPTGGSSWSALGQPQFTATPTSHAYAERGTYVASVTVEYAPAVDFGTGWLPVAGVVTATTGGYDVTIYEVRTALVERTCVENPSGPGC